MTLDVKGEVILVVSIGSLLVNIHFCAYLVVNFLPCAAFLKKHLATVHTSYRLNTTHVTQAEATQATHSLFCNTYMRNYMHCELSSCIGIHTCSPPIYNESSILQHSHVLNVTHNYHLYLYSLTTERPGFVHNNITYQCSDYKCRL